MRSSNQRNPKEIPLNFHRHQPPYPPYPPYTRYPPSYLITFLPYYLITFLLAVLSPEHMDLYAENILDHSKHPHHSGAINDASVVHTENNPSCGDTITLTLKIDGEKIVDIAWTGDGCAISQAGMSILSDELIGKNLQDVDAVNPVSIQALLGVPVGTRRLKCALLCLHTLKNALHSYKAEPLQTWHETVGDDDKTS